MRKSIYLFIIAFMIAGCAHGRYLGWEYVRIEKQVPNSKCVYKIQEACSKSGADCYEWYKQRATLFDANTVVITDMSISQRSSGSAVILNNAGGADYKSEEAMTSLADYYFCPKKEEINGNDQETK